MVELTDMATIDALMASHHNKNWNNENGVIDTRYSLTKIAGWPLLRCDNAGILLWKQKEAFVQHVEGLNYSINNSTHITNHSLQKRLLRSRDLIRWYQSAAA